MRAAGRAPARAVAPLDLTGAAGAVLTGVVAAALTGAAVSMAVGADCRRGLARVGAHRPFSRAVGFSAPSVPASLRRARRV